MMKRTAATAAAVVRNTFADSGIAEGGDGDGEGKVAAATAAV